MLIKTRGIVLRTVKYSETSIIMDVFTEELGLRSYIVSGVRSRKARTAASLLQPMNLLQMVVYHRNDKNLARTKELHTAQLYQSIPYNIRKSSIGIFITELLQKTIKEPETQKDLFAFLFDFFCFLDATHHPVSNIHLWFMLQYSAYLGFMPGGRYSAQSPLFDLQEGVFLGEAGSLHYLEAPHSLFLDQLLHDSIEQCHELKMSKLERKHLLENLIKYYRLHIESLKELNAHRVLEMVFEL